MLGQLPMVTASASAITAKTKSKNNDNVLELSSNATTTSSSSNATIEVDTGWVLTNFIGNGFHVIFSFFSDVIQAWKFYWWPSTKIIGTPHVVIELFQDTGKTSIVNVTNNVLLSPLSPSKDHLRSTNPTGQKLGLQEEEHSVEVEPQIRTKKTTSRPTSDPTDLPSIQTTRYGLIV